MLGELPDKVSNPVNIVGENDPCNASPENLIDGLWLVDGMNMPERGIIFNCAKCSVSFEDRVAYEIHVQGLKHKNANNIQVSTTPDVNKKLRHMSQLETILHEDKRPILGLNYVTEYFHAKGYYECICNLCNKVYNSIHSMKMHVFATSHVINFIFLYDKEMYNGLKFQTHDEGVVVQEATQLEVNTKGRICRTKIMEELGNIWVEFQHEGCASCSDLMGHQASRTYDNRASLVAKDMNTVDDVIGGFKKSFVISNGLPPSCDINNFGKVNFLDVLGKMSISSEKDADVCLQLANLFTLGVLKHRMKQVKNMKFVDTTSVRTKLNYLTTEAERVADKLSSRNQWGEEMNDERV